MCTGAVGMCVCLRVFMCTCVQMALSRFPKMTLRWHGREGDARKTATATETRRHHPVLSTTLSVLSASLSALLRD